MRSNCSRSLALLSAATLAVALSGCANNAGIAGSSAASATALTTSSFGGHVHGGNQPITGAALTLWAAGAPTTGGSYGSGATSVATTTSDSNGNFSFNVGNASPCTTGQYLYITAVGGNTGSGTNPYSALMAALPTPCSASTASTNVWINEVTTVAAVSALQQFMSISPTGTPKWKIGAPSTNLTGLANAFLMTSNLASIATGSSGVVTLTNTIGANTYTTTVNPDSAKINTIADILAFCVNSTGTTCSSLFTDTTPGSATAPSDTIQVAYYLATNAAGLSMPAYSNPQGSPYYLCNQYALPAAPFQPTLTCSTTSYPGDWMIGIQLKAVNTTTSATVGTITAGSVAIDGSGNVWTAADNSSATGGSITELNVLGEVILAPVTTATVSTTQGMDPTGWSGATTYTLGGARTNGLAIDTNGNAWYAGYYTTTAVDTLNPYGSLGNGADSLIVEITPAGVATGLPVGASPQAVVLDGSNNVYFQNQPNSYSGNGSIRNYISELPAAGTPAYSSYYPGAARATNIYNFLTVDDTPNQNIDVFSNTCGSLLQVNNASETALGNSTLPTTNTDGTIAITLTTAQCATNGAADPTGNIWATNSAGPYLEYINLAAGTVTGTAPAAVTNVPVVTQFTAGSGLTLGGLSVPKGVAIDGLGHLWVANSVSSTAGGVSEFVPNTTGTPTLTALSPAGITGTPIYGFGSSYGYATATQPVLDSSGNVWITTASGSYLYLLVGGAAPVVTPFASQIAKTSIGARP